MNMREALQLFVDACEWQYPTDTATWLDNAWPDLASAYLHAKDVLAREGQEEQE